MMAASWSAARGYGRSSLSSAVIDDPTVWQGLADDTHRTQPWCVCAIAGFGTLFARGREGEDRCVLS